MTGLVQAHSGLRWVVLGLLLWAIATAFSGWKNNKEYTAGDRKVHLFAMISVHIQILIGFILYVLHWGSKVNFSNMANKAVRFFSIEHVFIMVIAAVVITIGFSRGKRTTHSPSRFKVVFYTYLVGLLLILAGIPWPFRGLGTGWF